MQRSENLIHTVITRSSRAAGGCENAIICLINSNFWWNMSSLVSFSVSALLADYYNKTHLDQVTSIKTPQLSVNTRLWLGLSYNFLFSHRCQNLLDYFNQIWKLHKKKLASSPAEQEKMISNRLVRQFLVRAAFSPNNGAQWVFSETHREWAWLSSSAGQPKTITKRGGLICWRREYILFVILSRVWSWVLAGVLISPSTTDITLTVSTFKGSPALPPPPPAAPHWANDLRADPHYSSRGYFSNLWFGLNKYVDKNTLLIDQNNMRWAVSALENDSLAWKIGPPSFSVVVGSDKAGAGEEWKMWEIIPFLPGQLILPFTSHPSCGHKTSRNPSLDICWWMKLRNQSYQYHDIRLGGLCSLRGMLH